MHIALGILPIPCSTPARHWQHAYLLVIANSFRWHASGMGELADRQQVSHGPSSFLFLTTAKVHVPLTGRSRGIFSSRASHLLLNTRLTEQALAAPKDLQNR